MILVFIKNNVETLHLRHISSNNYARNLCLHRFRRHLSIIFTCGLVIQVELEAVLAFTHCNYIGMFIVVYVSDGHDFHAFSSWIIEADVHIIKT